LLSISSLQRGLEKMIINRDQIHKDLEDNWVVVSEAIQTILRREAYPQPYEALKKLTRTGAKITQQTFNNFIANLDVEDRVKDELIAITPFNYTGVLPQ
jgi:adenylosuccinate lyase